MSSEDNIIQLAMDRVRAKGLTDEQIQKMFEGEENISTREALLIAHIQHLEGKIDALSSIMEEIAALGDSRGVVAQTALERLVTPRKISGEDK